MKAWLMSNTVNVCGKQTAKLSRDSAFKDLDVLRCGDDGRRNWDGVPDG